MKALAAALSLLAVACTPDTPFGPGGREDPRPSATDSPDPCGERPVLEPAVRDAVERELDVAGFQDALGLGREPALARVRAVRRFTASSDGGVLSVTAVVFDATDGTRTATFAVAVRTSAGTATVDDWRGLVPSRDASTATVRVAVGAALFVPYLFTYGIVASPAVTTVRQVLTSEPGVTQELESPVCDGVFALGGSWEMPTPGLTGNRLEFGPPAGSPSLAVELDVRTVD